MMIKVGSFFNIPVYLHWSLLIPILLSAMTGSASLAITLYVIYFFVLVHEYGHALTARRYGIRTHKIVLYIIGGAAMMNMSKEAKKELIIAAAGPATSLACAALCLLLPGTHFPDSFFVSSADSFTQLCLQANVMLGIFNLIPVFPLDGGRIFRSVLHLVTGKFYDSTLWSVRIAQGIAIVAGVWCIKEGMIFSAIIAYMVFTQSENELKMIRHNFGLYK